MQDFELSAYDASLITSEKESAKFYSRLIEHTDNYKAAANWLNGPLRSYINENASAWEDLTLEPKNIAELIKLVDDNKISFSTASQKVFPELIKRGTVANVETLVKDLNLLQMEDDSLLMSLVKDAIADYPEKVEEYRSGKKGLIGLFMGEVMKRSQGKADPKKTNQLLLKELEN
jgi:aspartyl-tRNA(Asn)/glutamyl-tRNA(Gln) amidotransferase subunit B